MANIGTAVAIADMTKYGLGKHVSVMDMAYFSLYMKVSLRKPWTNPRLNADPPSQGFYVSIVMYCWALFFIKMAFLFQYYRVLAVQRMRIVYISCIVLVGGWALSQVFVGIFTCNPVYGFWDKTVAAECIPNIPQWYINAGGNIFTDVVVFALPLPALWSLNLAKQNRLILMGIFCLGFL